MVEPVHIVVPAHNEEQTLADVLRPLIASQVFASILVVDDGSKDGTSEVARRHGVPVMSLSPNRGKGEAMMAAVGKLPPGHAVAFCDADLMGLQPEHWRRMVGLFGLGYDMVCGLRDYSQFRNALQLVGPLITGERIVRRWVLDLLPLNCWRGYSIETAMNATVTLHGGKTAMFFMGGVGIRTKLDKTGWLSGTVGQAKMFSEIRKTQRALEQSDGTTCEL